MSPYCPRCGERSHPEDGTETDCEECNAKLKFIWSDADLVAVAEDHEHT